MSDEAKLRTRLSEFADRLEVLGFFRYAPVEAVAALKQDFEESRWKAIFGQTGRLFHADAEDLAEGGVGDFLRKIEPFLNANGIALTHVEDDVSEQGYSVTVNGTRTRIFDTDELHQRETQKQPGLIWGLSGARAFAIVNGLLEEAGSEERLYAVNGGNDLFGFFLTQALREAICCYPGIKPGARPYLDTDEYSWFGQEHL
jgi:hypothetical protein